jgi:hypothetical protein
MVKPTGKKPNDLEAIEREKRSLEYKEIKQNYINSCAKYGITPISPIIKRIDDVINGKKLTNVSLLSD